jgi:hypothetical protein
MTPSGVRGVLNDAISIYFADATFASAFVARCAPAPKVEIGGGVLQVREDEPAPRIDTGCIGHHDGRDMLSCVRTIRGLYAPRLASGNGDHGRVFQY